MTEKEKLLIKKLREENAELKQQNDLLQHVITHAPGGIFWKDINSVFLGCNKNIADAAGLKDPKDIVGKTDYDMPWKKEESDYFVACDKRVMKTRKPMLNIEETLLTKEGEEIHLITHKVPLKNKRRRIIGTLGTFTDITERKNAEEKLRKSTNILQALLDNTPLVIYIKDKQGRYQLANKKLKKLLHLEDEDILGKTDLDIFPRDIAQKLRRMDREVLASKKPIEQEEVVTFDGELYTYVSAKFPVYDPVKKEYMVYGISTDITSQKEAEQKLRKSNDQLQGFLDNTHSIVFIKDRQGRYQFINRRSENLFHMKAKDVIGKTSHDIFPQQAANAFKEVDDQVFATLTPIEQEAKVPVDGEMRNFISAKFPIYDPATDDYMLYGISTDITQQKEAERILKEHRNRLQEMVEKRTAMLELMQKIAIAANEATSVEEALQICLDEICAHTGWPVGHAYVYDEESGGLQSSNIWNTGCAKKFQAFRDSTRNHNFMQGKGLSGKAFNKKKLILYKNLTEKKNFRRLDAVKKAGFVAGLAFPLFSGTETVAVLEFFSTKPVNEDDQLFELLKNIGTQLGRVVERKHAEENQTQTMARLVRSNTELERFAYIASHDLKEPLRTISSYTQLIERKYEDVTDDEGREYMEYIITATDRMKMLINDLMNYSRLGTQSKSFEFIKSEDVLNYVLKNLRDIIEESNARITHGKLPSIFADSTQIAQLFQNIIGNAIKYRSKRPLEIKIQAELKGNEWLFSVKDNGIGMEKKYLNTIFMTFKRLHGASKYPGTGIGLAICRKVMENHGGTIWATSEKGKGSVFYFTIPVKKEDKKA